MEHFKRGNLSVAKSIGIGVCAKKVTKTERKEFVRNKLSSSKSWAEKALIKIWELQTDDEQAYGTTSVYNNMGFTGTDAQILTSFADGFRKYKRLTEKQMIILYKKMPKYWRQIIEISDADKLDYMIKISR